MIRRRSLLTALAAPAIIKASDALGCQCTGPLPTFYDDFTGTSISLYNHNNPSAGGTWIPSRWYSPDWDGYAVNSGWMANPFLPTTPYMNLFATDGVSSALLGGEATPAGQGSNVGNLPFVTAQISTGQGSFSQRQGYFEARIKMPNVPGSNLAFWLLNVPGAPNYQELDIVEFTNVVNTTAYNVSQNMWLTQSTHVNIPDDFVPATWFNDYHTYGVDWEASSVTFYVDRIERSGGTFATPATYTSAMFPILSYQLGGFVGDPLPGEVLNPMMVDYVAAWPSKPF